MIVKSDGSVKYESREELIETARKNGWALYMVRHHRDLKEFVVDMEARGIPMSIFPQYFDFVVFPDGRIVEIVGHDASSGELLTNTLFDEVDAVAGDSYSHGTGLSMGTYHRPK